MIGSILSFIAFGLLVILSVILIIKVAERRAYQVEEEKRKSSPVKEGDVFVLANDELKCYNVCFFVKEAHEGYYVGTLYSLINGKKRKCELVSAILLERKGFSCVGLDDIRDISFTDDEIKRIGFQRV